MTVSKVIAVGLQKSGYSIWSALALFSVFCVAAMMALSKFLFGTFSIRQAKGAFDKKLRLRKRYFQLFEMRENLLHHIAKAKSKDEISLMKNLRLELDSVDKVSFNAFKHISRNLFFCFTVGT